MDKDFENPLILSFEASGKGEVKADWKAITENIRKEHPKLKIIYSRGEGATG